MVPSMANDYPWLHNVCGDSVSDINLTGKWVFPHSADINIEFRESGKFVYDWYNPVNTDIEELRGNYRIHGNVLILYIDTNHYFVLIVKKDDVDNYYLVSVPPERIYLVRAD